MHVMVHKQDGLLYVVGAYDDENGVSHPTLPLHVVSASNNEQLSQVLSGIIGYQPPPGFIPQNPEKETLERSGVKSKTEFFSEAVHVAVFENGDEITVYPTKNAGPKDGYYYLPAEPLRNRTPQDIAAAIKAALDRSIIKPRKQ